MTRRYFYPGIENGMKKNSFCFMISERGRFNAISLKSRDNGCIVNCIKLNFCSLEGPGKATHGNVTFFDEFLVL